MPAPEQLSAVWIPDPQDEAIPDLSRAREAAFNSRTQARHQTKGSLLRHFVRYTGKTSWCGAYYRWLATLNFGADAAQTAFTEYWQAVKSADDRLARLTKASQGSIAGWRFESLVGALLALRGVGYQGLALSEHSSGERTSHRSTTKTSDAHAPGGF